MKRLLAIVLLIASPLFAKNDKREEATALFTRAASLMNVPEDKPLHFHGNVDIYVQAGKLSGTADVTRAGKDKRREEYHIGSYNEVEVTSPTQIARIRSVPFRPVAIRDLTRVALLPIPKDLPGKMKVDAIQDRQIGQLKLRCVDMHYSHSDVNTYCFDEQGLLRHSDVWSSQRDFDDFIDFDGVRVPRHIRESSGQNLIGEMHITELSTPPSAPELFAAPANAIVIPWCADMVMPKATHTPDPQYTETARKNKIEGTVLLELVVGTDGLVHDVHVVRPMPDGLDQQAVNAVKTWRFKPAMCGSTPAPREINVEVNFHLY